MRRKRVLAAIGMMGVVAWTTSCADNSVRKYLGDAGGPNGLVEWELKVGVALCQLEDHATGLDPTKRYCPQGSTDPPAVPKYPPPEE